MFLFLLSDIAISSILSNVEYLLLSVLLVLYFFFGTKFSINFKSFFKIIRWYILLEFAVIFSMALMMKHVDSNLFMSHIFFIGQFIILSLFYHKLLIGKQKKWVIAIAIIVFSGLIIQYSVKPSLFWIFNSFEVATTSLPLIAYSIVHLYNQLVRANLFVYINVGIMMYVSCSTLIFLLGDYLSALSLSLTFNIWTTNRVLYICYLLLFIVEFYYARKSKPNNY